MVWGVILQSSFGDFFPAGDYAGWREQREAYFNHEMPETEREKYGTAKEYFNQMRATFTKEIGVPRRDGTILRRMEEHECPSEFHMEKTYRSLASMINLTARLIAVNAAMKSLIEELEPGIHQFWPLRLTQPKGKEYPEKYYGLIVGQFLDSFSSDESAPESFKKFRSIYQVVYDSKEKYAGLALSKDKMGNAHLWRETRLKSPEFFMSDELISRLKSKRLRIPKHFPLKEF